MQSKRNTSDFMSTYEVALKLPILNRANSPRSSGPSADLDQAGFLTVITSLLASLCVAIWLHDLLWGEPTNNICIKIQSTKLLLIGTLLVDINSLLQSVEVIYGGSKIRDRILSTALRMKDTRNRQ
ncbi:hypothetical protein VTP01DRAFT_1977 [Rhizomucor pusillus]|uniref:uncharacterized protein n=1 Tax=Rhizomucor pusillus TaxID=4840 RepID=UPI003743C351